MSIKRWKLYLDLAELASTQSTCPKLRVGAVLVKDDRVLSMGYNGAPRGMRHCTDGGCDTYQQAGRSRCGRAVHAEMNAIVNAAYHGVKTQGASLFATHSPCHHCVKVLINAGIRKIFFRHTYEDQKSNDYCKEANIARICVA